MAGLLRGTPQERAESLFEVFDLTSRGRLSAADIKPFFPATRGDEMSEFIGAGTFAATVISFLFEQIQTTIGAVQRGTKVQVRRYTQSHSLPLLGPLDATSLGVRVLDCRRTGINLSRCATKPRCGASPTPAASTAASTLMA